MMIYIFLNSHETVSDKIKEPRFRVCNTLSTYMGIMAHVSPLLRFGFLSSPGAAPQTKSTFGLSDRHVSFAQKSANVKKARLGTGSR